MNSDNTITTKYNVGHFFKYIIIILSLFPFIQTSLNVFIPNIDNIFTVWKIVIVLYTTFIIFFSYKKIDYLLIIVFICNVYMLFPTLYHHGYFIKFFGYLIDSVGLLIILKYLVMKYNTFFLTGLKYFCRLMIYINFILLLLYPNGIFVEDNGYLVTRYLFLGMDNQAVALLIPFMIIIYAIEKKENRTYKVSFIIDVIVFFISIIMIWCGNSIVGIACFFIILIYQKISQKKVSVRTAMFVLAFLFCFIVLFQGYELFSSFIVEFLGKDMTLTGRTEIWANGIQEWLKYPIFGHGFHESEAFITFANVSGYTRGAHNQILNILLHGGIVYLFLFYLVFKKVHNITKCDKNNPAINILIIGLLIGFIMGIADTYGHLVGMYLLIGTMCYGKKLLEGKGEDKNAI